MPSLPEALHIPTALRSATHPFFIAGGWAPDLFIGRTTRTHADLDIAISRDDQLYFQNLLSNWDLQACDPPGSGTLRRWTLGERLENPIHNVWARPDVDAPWPLELLLCDFTETEWVYRRNTKIRGPVESFGWKHEIGLRVIAPEIQLLYKSRNPREKDDADFENCLPRFSIEQKAFLYEAIVIDSGTSQKWVEELRASSH